MLLPLPPVTALPLAWLLLQWQKYERKVVERSAEQHSSITRSAGLLDSMRKRFSTPAVESLAASTAAAPPGTALAAAMETPRPFSGGVSVAGSLKENLGTELNRSSTVAALFGAAAPTPAAAPTSGLALGGGGTAGSDSLLQQASSMFLQQVEEMRRKYTAEVEQLKVKPVTSMQEGPGPGVVGMTS